MNEPQSQCRIRFGTDWTAYQQVMVERIRRIAPQLPLFLTGGCWSNIEGIVLLDTDLLRDRRNFVSVHFYYPFLFTHQGATWSDALSRRHDRRAVSGFGRQPRRNAGADTRAIPDVALPPAPTVRRAKQGRTEIEKYFSEAQGPAQIEEWMNKVADWQRRSSVDSDRIVFTEFGAMKQTIDTMRDRSRVPRALAARYLVEHRKPRLGLDRLCVARRSIRSLCA